MQVATAPRSLGALLSGGREGAVPPAEAGCLSILIADDDEHSREALKAMVGQEGHRVLTASSGPEALSVFMREKPDLVLMDIVMPGLDGYQTTEYMRELSGDCFVPVVFVTALQDEAALSRCITSGGSDFLVKPFNREILKAKIDGFARLRRMLQTIRSQRDEMAGHNRWLKHEYQVAEAVFAKVMHSDALRAPNIKYLVSPQAVFNGDILLAAYRPSGELHLMIGDFTGHGLSAAIGAIPVADIFHGMTAKGFPIPEIIAEMNHKLLRVLPRGLFLGAALLELDAGGRTLSVWNGGLPDVVVTAGDRQKVIARLGSRAFPLGVVETGQLDCTVETLGVEPGYHIYVHTDGLTETDNGAGERFGEARLHGCFGREGDSIPTYDRILNDLQEFRGYRDQSDDVTLLQVVVDAAAARKGATQAAAGNLPGPRAASAWSAGFGFGLDTLRSYDPLPTMLQVLLDAQRLYQHKQRIYMVLAELFMNALEHGLLGLDSAIKAGPNGFSEYYREKERRLREIPDGFIKVELEHAATDSGGRLVIRVEDSGPGFDFAEKLRLAGQMGGSGSGCFGRGIAAVRALCESLAYHGEGNRAEAVYVWDVDGAEE